MWLKTELVNLCLRSPFWWQSFYSFSVFPMGTHHTSPEDRTISNYEKNCQQDFSMRMCSENKILYEHFLKRGQKYLIITPFWLPLLQTKSPARSYMHIRMMFLLSFWLLCNSKSCHSSWTFMLLLVLLQ